MTKFQPIVLSLVFAYASAAGCYPAYSPGTTYAIGTSVSQVVTTITPISWTSCDVSPTCTTGWVQVGGVITTSTHNFACTSNDWCVNPGFAPGGVYSELAWTKEEAVCSGTAVVPAATLAPSVAATLAPTPAVWTGIGCPGAYVAGAPVDPGASVSVVKTGVTLVYTCNTDTTSGWCPLVGYEPGTGQHWGQAWTLSGSCTGTLTPTSSPTTLAPTSSPSSLLPNQGGCPSAYAAGGEYKAGDMVTKNGMVFKCNAGHYSLFCPMGAYEPLSTAHGDAYKLAWSTVGPCTGTIAPSTATPTTALPTSSPPTTTPTTAPTSSPSSYTGTCTYDKIVVTAGPAVPCEHGSSTSCSCTLVDVSVNPLGYTCTKPSEIVTTTATVVDPWSASTTYAAGDVVRVGVDRFKCKPHPFTGWCSNAMYAPAVGVSGIWTEAWTPEVDKCPLGP